MGSLPNLHELSKDKLGSPVYKPAPIGGLGPMRLPPQPPPLAHTHKRARSSGHHHSTLCDNDAMLEVPITRWNSERFSLNRSKCLLIFMNILCNS